MRLGLAPLMAVVVAFGGLSSMAVAADAGYKSVSAATARALGKARAAAKKGDHATAIAAYDEALKLEPNFAPVITERAFVREASGDLAGAAVDYAEAVRLAPTRPNAWSHVAWIEALRGGDLDRALADSEKAVSLGATSDAVDTRGFVHFRRGEYALALADYQAVLNAYPRVASPLFMRGVVKRRLGLDAEGDADIARALKIDKTVEALWVRRGVTR